MKITPPMVFLSLSGLAGEGACSDHFDFTRQVQAAAKVKSCQRKSAY